MKIKILLSAAVLILMVSCSENQNPISSNIETGDNENTTTTSGSGYTIIEGEFIANVKPDTIHFEPNQYKMHMYMMETGFFSGEWEQHHNIRVNYDAGTIILNGSNQDCRYRIILFQ